MRRWQLVAAVAVLALGLAACGKIVVVPVPATQATTAAAAGSGQLEGEGVFYALPRTVVRVLVKADQTVSRSARYARFAPIFAPGVTPPCRTIVACAGLEGQAGSTTKYAVQQGATFSTFGEPDPTKVFMVKFTGGGALDQAISMAWSEKGLLSTASASVTNRTTDIAMSSVKLATGLATKLGAAGPGAAAPEWDGCTESGHPLNGPASYADQWVVRILAESPAEVRDVLIANFCNLPGTDDGDSRDDYDEACDADELREAVRAYTLRVEPLVRQRTAILTSSTVSILEPVEYLEKLDTLIDEQLRTLFGGSTSTKTWELPFEVRDLAIATPAKLLGVNETDGICPEAAYLAPDAVPAPSGFGVLPAERCAVPMHLTAGFHPAQQHQLFSRVGAGVVEGAGDRSFRYIIPAQVKATVSVGDTTYGTGLFAMAQFGQMVSLPARRNSKTLSYDLAMIEATGGLKTFKIGTTGGVDAATIDAAGGVAGTVLDAGAARRKEEEQKQKAAETAADELTLLTRQHTLLKLKDDICTLQKKYGLACTVEP